MQTQNGRSGRYIQQIYSKVTVHSLGDGVCMEVLFVLSEVLDGEGEAVMAL